MEIAYQSHALFLERPNHYSLFPEDCSEDLNLLIGIPKHIKLTSNPPTKTKLSFWLSKIGQE
jgi:hypothetical protein